MAITGLDALIAGLLAGVSIPYQKGSIATQLAGSEASLWRATGYPAQGAIPGAAAICSDATTGAFPLAARTGGEERAIGAFEALSLNAGTVVFVEDRLGHMGGLNGTLTTAQTVNLDLHSNLATSNIAARIGNSDYSEVEWYLEWYTATGATVATPTVNVTYDDGTTGNCNVWVAGATALPASVAAGRRYKIIPAVAGRSIRAVNSVTLSASTGTAGSFGVTAVRRKMTCTCQISNRVEVMDWQGTRVAIIPDNACITLAMSCITTSTGALGGLIQQAVA